MKIKIIFLVLVPLFLIGGVLVFIINKNKQSDTKQYSNTNNLFIPVGPKSNMRLTSSAFSNNQLIPVKYTCNGENVNPPLTISGVHENTKSLVLIIDDPDALVGTWTHWTVWNINPTVASIGENSLPTGSIQGITSFGKPGYGGPCPPSSTHHYYFKLYALDTTLDLVSSAKKDELEKAMIGHILEKTELIGLYGRK